MEVKDMKRNRKLAIAFASIMLALGALVGCKKEAEPEPSVYKVKTEGAVGYVVSGINAEGYEAGAAVKFTINVTDSEKEVYKVKYAVGKPEYEAIAAADGSYSFVMPEHEVKLFAVLRNVDKYNIQLVGDAKYGLTVDAQLRRGTMPVTVYSVEGLEPEKVKINGTKVQFLSTGATTLVAKMNSSEVARITVNVEATAHGESPLDPLSVDEAITKCKALTPTTDSKNPLPSEVAWYVRGVVNKVEENDTSFGNATLVLFDPEATANVGDTFTAYRCSFASDFDRSQIDLGSVITLNSKLLHYKTSTKTVYETNGNKESPSTLVSINNDQVQFIDTDPARGIKKGDSIDLRIEGKPSIADFDPSKIEYEFGDTSIARLFNGHIRGMAVGTTTVKVIYDRDGLNLSSDNIELTVGTDEVHGQTADDPISGAEAVTICNGLASGGVTKAYYYVEDYVTKVTENNPAFSNATCYIAGGFYVYRSAFADGFDRDNVCVGSKITVRATLKNYNGTAENDDCAFVKADVSVAKGVYLHENLRALRLQVGKSSTPDAYVQPLTGNFPATFEIADTSIATVNAKGKVTAAAAGETTLTIKYIEDDVVKFQASKPVVVTEGEPVYPAGETKDNPFTVKQAVEKCSNIAVGEEEYEFYIRGDLTTFSGFSSGSFGGSMKDKEDESKVFTLYKVPASNDLGAELSVGVEILVKVTLMLYSGTTPENNSGSTGLLEVVHPGLTGVALKDHALSLGVGDTSTLVVKPVPDGALLGDLTWESDNNEVVTVENGVITCVSAGTANVTVRQGEYHDTCAITVQNVVRTKVAEYNFSQHGTASTKAISESEIKARFAQECVEGEGLSDIVTAVSEPSNVYSGNSGEESLGLKLGKSSEAGKFTITTSVAIGRVKLVGSCLGNDASCKIKVNDVELDVAGKSAELIFNLSESSTTLTFEISIRGMIGLIELYTVAPAE